MHDPKLIEVMVRAMEACPPEHPNFKIWRVYEREATAALTALCTLRPDVAAVLRGEAVAVPREATDAMASRVNGTCVTVTIDGTWAVTRQEAKRIHAALIAASPYAKETPDGE